MVYLVSISGGAELDISNWDIASQKFVNKVKLLGLKYLILSDETLLVWDKDEDGDERVIIYLNSNKRGFNIQTIEHIEGIDNIKVTGPAKIRSLRLGSERLTKVEIDIDTSDMKTAEEMFLCCFKLKSVKFTNFNTSNIVSFNSCFDMCNELREIDISKWDTHNAVNTHKMFAFNKKLKAVNLEGVDFSNVRDFSEMFCNCAELETINGIEHINVRSATTMHKMFLHCRSLSSLNLSRWKVRSPLNVAYMFSDCSNLKYINIENVLISNLNNLNSEFFYCREAEEIHLRTKINASEMYDISLLHTFYACHKLRKIVLHVDKKLSYDEISDQSVIIDTILRQGNCLNTNNIQIVIIKDK